MSGPRTWGQRHPRLLLPTFLVALVLAVGAAGWQGYRGYAAINPPVAPVLAFAVPVIGPGLAVQLTEVRRAHALPAADAGDPDVHGPDGSDLLLVFFTVTLTGPEATADDALCDFTLFAPDGTRWVTESDYGYALRRPEALTCGGDGKLAPGAPVQGAVNFLVPSSQRDLVLEVGLSAFEQTARRQL